jgi:hypothetical protein
MDSLFVQLIKDMGSGETDGFVSLVIVLLIIIYRVLKKYKIL